MKILIAVMIALIVTGCGRQVVRSCPVIYEPVTIPNPIRQVIKIDGVLLEKVEDPTPGPKIFVKDFVNGSNLRGKALDMCNARLDKIRTDQEKSDE